ncbi:SAM-dependent methyltransferase [Oceaniglobus indicus]|uniref:SAM-dependent methyltransferase n=1 Tax=Oceaniglobus indicus TaxID=2047749 RepID=UPI000C1A2D87|nr:cyclopropane-fatty-acyl-phospholipid synthase family protein [Oceaniglobus indicus]
MWETVFETFLRQLWRRGTLRVTLPSGRLITVGDGTGTPFDVTITDPTLLRRIATTPDLGVGEGYMDGTLIIEGDDLRGFMDAAVANTWSGRPAWWQRPLIGARKGLRWAWQWNPVGRAQANVAHHYDLSGELYDLFLDDDKQYSCGYFRHPDDTLDAAQAQKKAHIAKKLRIEPGMRVLDIGCGWGGMGLTLARDYDAQVVGVTLSREQHAVATARARAAGLDGQVDFRIQDYRHLTQTFDRIVSVGMFEHVGAPHFREYFRHVHDLLAPDGIALIHTIGRSTPPGITSPWIEKYIFPGGYVPALSEMTAAIEREHLYVTDVEVWRLHYAETLRHWEQRFSANIEKARALYDDRFCRMWRFYLLACEQTFRHGRQVVFQTQLTHRKDAVPLTRDYMCDTGG